MKDKLIAWANKLLNVVQIPQDKLMHALWGLVVGAAFGHYPYIAAAVLLAQSVGKELVDYIINKATNSDQHEVSVMDAAATIAGGVIGVLAYTGAATLLGN